LGYPDRAISRVLEALEKATEAEQPYLKALSTFILSFLAFFRGDIELAIKYGSICVKVSADFGIIMFGSEVKTFLGAAHVQSGNQSQGFAMIQEAISWRSQQNVMAGMNFHLGTLANVQLECGDEQGCAESLDRALAINTPTSESLYLSEIYRLKGLMSMKAQERSSEIEAEDWLNKSLNLSRSQESKALELRSAMALARLKQVQGKNVEALNLVSGVYQWFTEGFKTKDLNEAKQMIDELSINLNLTRIVH
jgi:adenylate cyclase